MTLTIKKKVRGAKQKSLVMVENIKLWTKEFPEVDSKYGYWHCHMPFTKTFIDSTKTPSSVRRLCIQTLIDQVEYLISVKPKLDLLIRVVAAINLPNLSDSQIIIFFGDTHYNGFFNRNDEIQKWSPLSKGKNIAEEWHLKIPIDMKVKGYKEEFSDGKSKSISEYWFIGEID